MKRFRMPAAFLAAVLLVSLLAGAAADQDLAGAVQGDSVTFGSYEQDGSLENGPQPIEWIVADNSDGVLLLISRYELDVQPYHVYDAPVTWENCSLRTWLAETFMPAAFTAEEQALLVVRTKEHYDYAAPIKASYQEYLEQLGEVTGETVRSVAEIEYAFLLKYGYLPDEAASDADYWVTCPDTTDLVFLFCSDDVEQYGESLYVHLSGCTQYAVSMGGDGSWWAGTPNYIYTTEQGNSDETKAGCYSYADSDDHSLDLAEVRELHGVRPAIRLKIR